MWVPRFPRTLSSPLSWTLSKANKKIILFFASLVICMMMEEYHVWCGDVFISIKCMIDGSHGVIQYIEAPWPKHTVLVNIQLIKKQQLLSIWHWTHKKPLCKSEISSLATSCLTATVVVIMPKRNQSHGCQFGPRHRLNRFVHSFFLLSLFFSLFLYSYDTGQSRKWLVPLYPSASWWTSNQDPQLSTTYWKTKSSRGSYTYVTVEL